MRPCCRCRTPIENSAATCPQCEAAQDTGPKTNPDAPPPQRGFVRQFMHDLSPLLPLEPVLAITGLAIPLLSAGALGYYVGGTFGALAGFVGAAALIIGAIVWAESGG